MPRKFSVVALSFIILFLSAPGKASAESIDPVIKRMVAKYKKINAKVKDMSFEQEMEMTDPGGKSITQKIKFYKKGKKYRMDMVMKMPSNP
ncbi:MAG TPA: hypothetical protein ENI77_00310, partial [Nitrospirae bacterium]|nr:hypothetical protein [Nitrospirota bacterium]